ncbi:hypothetical protein BEH_11750 [Priestia filamentosa]|uniref:Uncharacterized protein n=1 Tax=Priestia filamentosa TaxID=1402861 RepID=A0A0H4KWK9_9BACI|nr:hypothetical protein [Priestia filamentosa]AKO92708.1 hypothetical protein BEH_11750 [Priestia filamentosa]
MPTYDPKYATLIVDGRYITGFDEGTMFTAEKDEDFFTTKADAQGVPIVTESNDPFGTVASTLSQTSTSYEYLKQLAKRKTPFPVWVNYNDGVTKEKAGGTQARITKTPSKEFSNEASGREFSFKVFDYTEE